eukprot:1144578-Pelagomonas_calceolata.AAC.6
MHQEHVSHQEGLLMGNPKSGNWLEGLGEGLGEGKGLGDGDGLGVGAGEGLGDGEGFGSELLTKRRELSAFSMRSGEVESNLIRGAARSRTCLTVFTSAPGRSCRIIATTPATWEVKSDGWTQL